MRFPLTQQLLDEARAFSLRAACRDCFFWREGQGDRGGECWHGWPDEGQRSWPLARVGGEAAARAGGEAPEAERGEGREIGGAADRGEAEATGETGVGGEVAFCKEFELR